MISLVSQDIDFLFLFMFFDQNLSGCFVHSALSEEEKTSLRAGLITNFNEPVNQVSVKNDIYY